MVSLSGPPTRPSGLVNSAPSKPGKNYKNTRWKRHIFAVCEKIRLVALQFRDLQLSEIENRGWERTFARPGSFKNVFFHKSKMFFDYFMVKLEWTELKIVKKM